MSQPIRKTGDVGLTSGCPFLSRTQPTKDRSIEELLKEIVHVNLHQPSIDITPWVRTLRQNLITCESALKRLRPNKLQELHLPLLLEQELEEYCDKSSKKTKSKKSDASGAKSKPKNVSAFTKKPVVVRVSVPVAFGLDEAQRTLVKNSWNALATSHETGVGSPLHQFFVQFYQNFFEADSRGRALFEGRSMVAQAQVLMRMITMIIHALDDPSSLTPVLKKLGVRHLIYGVEQRNFQSWGLALAKTLESVLGADICTRETKEAWFLLVQGLSAVMMQDYDQIRDGYSGKLFKRENNSWRLYEVIMTHERLSLYKDAERTKLKEEIWLNLIDDIELIPMHTDDAGNFPTQYAFRLSAGGALRVDLCALSETQLLHWMDDVTERIRAHQRAQPPPTEEADSESIASSMSDVDNLEDDLDYDLAIAEQGAEPREDSSLSEDSDDVDADANRIGMLSDDEDDHKKFRFVGFTGLDRKSSSKPSGASQPITPVGKQEKRRSSSSPRVGLPPLAPESPVSAPATPTTSTPKKKNWRTRAEKKIKKLQTSLQIKNANKQRPSKASGVNAKVY